MRALLVVNHVASSTTPELRDRVAARLSSALGAVVEHTTHAGHATELARQAAEQGCAMVIALGGDGTVNEVATGLLAAGTRATALAALPGGNANVFARNLGLPRDPIAATERLIEIADSRTSMGVGRVQGGGHDRYFLCNAGMGLDAAVVARVAERRSKGLTAASDALYARLSVVEYLADPGHRRPHLRVDGDPAALALVVNFSPWTYVGGRGLDPHPRSGLDCGLSVIAPSSLAPMALVRLLARIAANGDVSALSGVTTAAQVDSLPVTADRATWLQVDGDSVGRVSSARFEHLPSALSVVASV